MTVKELIEVLENMPQDAPVIVSDEYGDQRRKMEHPYQWERGKPFPPAEILKPPQPRKGLWVGVCVYCGGSLSGPYQEDLYHEECDKQE